MIGFSQQQVSRFRSALADEDAYRERLVRRCMREAMPVLLQLR
jgi:hypothetical protein